MALGFKSGRGPSPKRYYGTHIRIMCNKLGKKAPSLKGKSEGEIHELYKDLKSQCQRKGYLA
jgi:hypothetical protein